MLLELIILFLGVSLLLYCLLGGADFGAGILEAFMGTRRRDEQRELFNKAMGPVWEANHMWLVLGVVILFNGFPAAFRQLSITFHIPITLMLLGIILRGCAFTFRHYDAVHDRSQTVYSAIFVVSSFATPLWLGVIAGGLLLGRVDLLAANFFAGYIAPWLNLFCFAVGGFVCALFAFLASVYLIGEAHDDELRAIFSRRARFANLVAVVFGALVFLAAAADGFPLLSWFLSSRRSLVCMGLSTALFLPLWYSLRHKRVWPSRVLAAAQVALVLFGWFALQAPVLIAAHSGTTPAALTFAAAAAPAVTLRYLLAALIGGAALIFPALLYLLKVFKSA